MILGIGVVVPNQTQIRLARLLRVSFDAPSTANLVCVAFDNAEIVIRCGGDVCVSHELLEYMHWDDVSQPEQISRDRVPSI